MVLAEVWKREVVGLSRTYRFSSRRRPVVSIALIWVDSIVFNLVFFLFLKALILYPVRFSTIWHILVWGTVFVCWVVAFDRVRVWGRRARPVVLAAQLVLFFTVAGIVTGLSTIEASTKGFDWSWLRPEMIKTPWWLRMFIPMSPLFTIAFVAVVCVLMWRAVVTPRSWFLRLVPAGAVLVLVWLVVMAIKPVADPPLDPLHGQPRVNQLAFYLRIFVGPAVVFCVLVWLRWFTLAFRTVPFVLHMSLIALNYIGVLPVHSLRDSILGGSYQETLPAQVPGVTILYPGQDGPVDQSFRFLRRIAVTDDYLYANYGPTCGIYEIGRTGGEARKLEMSGLMRDLRVAPDNRTIWGLNWQYGDFVVFSPAPISISCYTDLFSLGFTTPYNMLLDGDRLFITNVTYPKVGEFVWEDPNDPCSLKLTRSIDFYKMGFTKFTDAAFGMHLDKRTNRLYVIVALVDGKYLGAMVEIDLDTFEILRNIKLTTGNHMFPIKGRDHVLVPSYYTADLHEVSLTTMEEVRTIVAKPNIVAIEHDAGRGLFYAVCRASGLLLVIDDRTGATLKSVYVGVKPEPLWYDTAADQLYVGSGSGILRIDLKRFLVASGS